MSETPRPDETMIGPEDIKENAEGTVQPPAVPADSAGGTEQPAVEPPAVPAEAKTGQDAGAPAAEAKKAPLPPAKEKVQNASLKNGVIRIRKIIRRMKKKAAARSSSKAAGKTGAKSAPKKTAAKTTDKPAAKAAADTTAKAAPKRSSGTASHSGTRKRKKKLKVYNLLTMIVIFFLVLEIIAGAAGGALVSRMLEEKPKLVVDDFFSPESSHVYDMNGTLIADVGTQLRENVSYNELSEAVIDAFLATEDSRYFDHDGFDISRFTKSVFTTVKNILIGSSARQGGSTFTMQLVKLTYWQNEEAGIARSKDIEYKIQQIALARELEKETDKKSILELYLNKLNFGGTGNIRGIEMASQYYYGKSAGELNLAEAAMLAGVINSPYYYDPHNFLDYATARRNTVLSLMLRHGYIKKSEYQLAVNIKVEDTLVDPSSRRSGGTGGYAYQSYIDTAIREAEKITGQDPYSVAMEIYTYMDPDVQTVMDNIQAGYYEDVWFPDDLMEVGMISEDNHTGAIVAVGGGRNYGRGGSMLLNHATSQYKQPGSSVKPILDYALAFEYLGWATSHVVTDRPLMYEGTNIIVKNASGSYGGQMTLEYAVGNSLNTPAIQTLQEVINKAGWQTVVNYIMSLGFSQITEDSFDIGFAIGGSNLVVSCEELMAAHAVLMNGGYYIEPHTIQRIEFRSGLYEPIEPYYEPSQVLTEQAAYLAAYLMYRCVSGPYYNYMQLLQRDYPVYAKTGTTDWGDEGLEYNIPSGVAKDKWMVSETSRYTTAVWVGYEKGEKDANTYFSDEKQKANIPGYISNHILSALTDDIHPEGIPRPEGISDIQHILGTFPYASVIPGMPSSLIANGMIKSDYYNLVEPSEGTLATIYNFNVIQESADTLTLTWPAYPDAEKLEDAGNTMDISLYDAYGNMLVEAYGNRLFDYSWIYGPVRYKATLTQNGQVVGQITSDSETTTENVNLLPGIDVQACGYYGYEKSDVKSNEICVSFRAKESSRSRPDNQSTGYDSTVPDNIDGAIMYNYETAKAWSIANGVMYMEVRDTLRAGTFEVVYDTDDAEQVLAPGTDINKYNKDNIVTIYYFG
ncbi:MAG: transglycosylase domain-containing protein [Solobacterium sp.]|nr:transglycosylase domain-containing protein [Solobacterium sp.]